MEPAAKRRRRHEAAPAAPAAAPAAAATDPVVVDLTSRPPSPSLPPAGSAAASPTAPPPRDDGGGEGRPPPLRLRSPWQLTSIPDLPARLNRDSISLGDVLGDPLITEVWNFNFVHDLDFVLAAFDPDTRALVQLRVVHGFWKREDPARLALEEQAARYPNVALLAAPMPEMFGTHHSKLLILFRADDTAEVVVHTANMIPKDWTVMTNAVWRSPRLPLLESESESGSRSGSGPGPSSSGLRFGADLIAYLDAYNARRPVTKLLVDRLRRHDFTEVRAALVASVPGRHALREARWGWPALKRTLGSVPACTAAAAGRAEVVVQVSSIATLGPRDTWLRQTLFGSLGASVGAFGGAAAPAPAKFKIVFPTADEIRRSVGGYGSGTSIHMKIQSAQQQKQLEYMRPHLHHWANDCSGGRGLELGRAVESAGRERAAPHIKTYIRYRRQDGDDGRNGIDKGNGKEKDKGAERDGPPVELIEWAMLTSANVSKQAWGEAATPAGLVRIASWEIGIVIWPALLLPPGGEGTDGGRMVATFGTDAPAAAVGGDPAEGRAVVGLRIPYSLPLQQYSPGETPWVATMDHAEPDRHGKVLV